MKRLHVQIPFQSDLFPSVTGSASGRDFEQSGTRAPDLESEASSAPAIVRKRTSRPAKNPVRSVDIEDCSRSVDKSGGQQIPSRPFLSVKQVAERYGLSVATIWRWSKERDDFPRPRKLGSGSTRWKLDDLVAFERSDAPRP